MPIGTLGLFQALQHGGSTCYPARLGLGLGPYGRPRLWIRQDVVFQFLLDSPSLRRLLVAEAVEVGDGSVPSRGTVALKRQ